MGKWKEGTLKPPGSDSVCAGPASIRRIGWNVEWKPVGRCLTLQELRRYGLYGCTKYTTDVRYHKAGNGEEPIQDSGAQLGKDTDEWSRTVGRFVAEAPGYGRYAGCGRGCSTCGSLCKSRLLVSQYRTGLHPPHDIDCTFPTCHLSPATVAGCSRSVVLWRSWPFTVDEERLDSRIAVHIWISVVRRQSSLCLLVCEHKSRTRQEAWGKGARGMTML